MRPAFTLVGHVVEQRRGSALLCLHALAALGSLTRFLAVLATHRERQRAQTRFSDLTDILGRAYGRQFLETANSASGEGWIHYMHPEPGDIFPTWKSTFVKSVTFPSGRQYLIGSGIYNMRMDTAFIADVVDRAAALVAQRGKDAFGELRDTRGPFVFLDTYVFVDRPDGTELVNPGQPSLEGKNILDLKDLNGKALASDYIAAALENGSAWVEYYWYKPGHNTPARKQAYVRKVQHGEETYIVGSGLYMSDETE